MVKKLVVCVFLSTIIILLFYYPETTHASAFNEMMIGIPPKDSGEYIISKSGLIIIEFWHYSGGYWKATMETKDGLKEIIIWDSEADLDAWTDLDFLKSKIYDNSYVLEYRVWHPQEVLDAITKEAEITPVMSIDTAVIRYSDDFTIPSEYFNFDPLPSGLSPDLPEKPEYTFHDGYMEIRALPKLNCLEESIINMLEFYYPHKIPLVRPGFGSISYSLFHHDGSYAGVGYSPDPFYEGVNTIPYEIIQDIQGRLVPGHTVTTGMIPERRDEDSGNLRIGYNTFANAGAVSIRFWYPIRIDYYAKYKETDPPEETITPSPSPSPTPTPDPEPSDPSTVTETLTDEKQSDMEPASDCVIRADNRGAELFDVMMGIPVSENLYVNARAKEYLYKCEFTEHSHTGTETIRVKKTYNLKWEEDQGYYETDYCGSGVFRHVKGTYCTDSDGDGINDSCPGHPYNGCRDSDGDNISDYCPGHDTWVSNWVEKTDTQVVYSDPHIVSRDYSYWTIKNFEVFVPDKVTIENQALPGGVVTIPASGIASPEISVSHNPDISDHVLKDPFETAKDNGVLEYDLDKGLYIIDLGTDNIDGGTSKPSVPAISNYISVIENTITEFRTRNDSLTFNGITILNNNINENGNTEDPYNIPEAVLCHDDAFYKNQLLIPNQVLNGIHNSSGNVSYKRLSETVNPAGDETIEIEFPHINSVTVHTPVVCVSGVFDDISNDQSPNPATDRAAVILGRPSKIRFLTVGEHLNIPGYNDPQTGLMDCKKYTRQMQVKFPFDVYIGTNEPVSSCFLPANTWYSVPKDKEITDLYVPVWVSEGDYEVDFREIAVNAPNTDSTQGIANLNINKYVAVKSSKVRVIGRIYGLKVTDVNDSLWQEVFRVNTKSSEHTGNYYYVGTRNEDGIERGISSLFTLPLLEGSHSIYKNRGALKTGYTFKFELETIGGYYGDKDYINIIPEFYYVKKDGTVRQRVDLWYHDEFNGKTNYFVKMEPQGRNRENPLYMKLGEAKRNVPEEEITDTARLLGMDKNSFRNKTESIGWFDRIILTKSQRTFTGPKEWLPSGVDIDKATMSVQKWYGEYHLPNDLYVSPQSFDVPEYGRTHNGLDGKESFWLKDGYIIVNFRIEAVKNGDFDLPSLSYWGSPRCNMFEREGFKEEKTDFHGVTFTLMDGDIVFYDTDKRSTDDYSTGGTH